MAHVNQVIIANPSCVTSGTVEAWKENVSALCVGNTRLVFSVACAFAGGLLRPAGMASGGFHLYGDASSGKTTALRVAASVFGGPASLQGWRTSEQALEAIAAQHCDGLLILDELAQVDPQTARDVAHMLTLGQGKSRATRAGALPRAFWRLLFLSAGEVDLSTYAQTDTKTVIDIPADAGAGMGAFETLHGMEGGADFARHITGQAGSVYGAVGHAWMSWLVDQADTFPLGGICADSIYEAAAELLPPGSNQRISRVAARFALVGMAGELATNLGLTGWPKGESERAARACFDAWLTADAQRATLREAELMA